MKKKQRKQYDQSTAFGQSILEGLRQVVETIEKGIPLEERFIVRSAVSIPKVKKFTGRQMKNLRVKLGVSQSVFAELIGTSLHAIHAWEQGKRKIPKMACRLMEAISDDPTYWTAMLLPSDQNKRVA